MRCGRSLGRRDYEDGCCGPDQPVSGSKLHVSSGLVMTRDVVLCRSEEPLRDVWARMKERRLKNIPVVGQNSRPQGLLHARDILQLLLSETESDEALLRDYVMGVGYR